MKGALLLLFSLRNMEKKGSAYHLGEGYFSLARASEHDVAYPFICDAYADNKDRKRKQSKSRAIKSQHRSS